MLPQCDLIAGGILRELGDLSTAADHLEAAEAGHLDPYEAAWLAWEQALLAHAQHDPAAAAAHRTAAQVQARALHNAWLERQFSVGVGG
jgi:hypothetical protein